MLLDSLPPRQEAPVAQVRPFMQHPPPREAGQENQPVEHVYADLEEEEVGVGVVLGVEELELVDVGVWVGVAMAVEEGVAEEVVGWT